MECLRNVPPPRQGHRETAQDTQTGDHHIVYSTYFLDVVERLNELFVSQSSQPSPLASTGVYRVLHHGGTDVVAGTQGRTGAHPLR